MYFSIQQILFVHFLMGIGACIGFAAYARQKNHPRKMFTFGGDVFSLGESKRWLKWYVITFIFEVCTSVIPAKHTIFYVELALSFVEAGCLTAGAFLVDRVLLVFEGDDDSPPEPRIARRTRRAREREEQAQAEAAARQAERAAFERSIGRKPV